MSESILVDGPGLEEAKLRNEVVLPAAVKSSTHGVVHYIVTRRHRVEDVLDHFLFLLVRDLLRAEVDSGFGGERSGEREGANRGKTSDHNY